jgi:3',5'-cyclic AMP phosphodiesterase CpdA
MTTCGKKDSKVKGKMYGLKIAVISDLHIGEKARWRDLRPEASGEVSDDDYKGKFDDFVKSKRIVADYLIIPGDITNTARPREFEIASRVISNIARALSVKEKQIIFVPGNHDADWLPMRGDPRDTTGLRKRQRYDPICMDGMIFKSIIRRAKRNMFDNTDFCWWEYRDLVVFGYNSSWDDGPASHEHHGLVSDKSLGEIEACLQALDIGVSKLKILVVHHHPVQYSNPIPYEPDFSIMVNADHLLDILVKYQFDLLIHGHKHVPYFQSQIRDSGFPLVVLCAGSFSAEIGTKWNGIVNNQFHLIKVDGRDPESKAIYGEMQSWTYVVSQGWVPSYSRSGIQHRSPFGTYVQWSQIRKSLETFVREKFLEKDFIEWSDIVSAYPEYDYVPTCRITEVLDDLSARAFFRIVGDIPDIILIKNKKKKSERRAHNI